MVRPRAGRSVFQLRTTADAWLRQQRRAPEETTPVRQVFRYGKLVFLRFPRQHF